ncbi:MAG: hypothetical protein NVV59_07000 [Chitinophagaceae bacterium]|nr:hypothetical protein [Chitinophagaceae bacterium]
MKLKLYTIISLLVLLTSCRSAEKLYNRGDYDGAVELATKKLAKKPGDTELIGIVRDAYRFAVDDHESRIRNLSNSQSELRFEQILAQYGSLQRLYEAIRRSPTAFDVVQPTDYSSYLQTYREEAGNVREYRGDDLMAQNTKQSFRQAYTEYQKALSLKPGDVVLKQKADEAYWSAVTHISIQPLSRFGIQYTQYGFDYNQFDQDLLRYLNNHRQGQFLNFFGMNQPGVRADFNVELRFSDVNIGRYHDQRETREVTKQVVSKEIIHSKDSVTREYITVKAKITTTTRTLQANALLQAIARDTSGDRRVWSDTYRGDYNWVARFATYTGDERALSDEDKKMINSRETYPPENDQIIRIIMQEIRSKTECGISDYFNRYQ